MVTVAALALLGLNFAAKDPWINQLMGVSQAQAKSLIKMEDDGYVSKDGATILDIQGDPTSLVWAMKSEDDSEEQFSVRDLLDHLGFDGKKAEYVVWEHDDEKTPLFKSVPGLKEGWTAFTGAYDLLFVGPELGGDFDQTGKGVQTGLPSRLAEFTKDLTWKGAIGAYGKPQHMELMEADLYVVTWRCEGPICEVGLNIDISSRDAGADVLKGMRADPTCVAEFGFTFKPGIKDWKTAFAAAGFSSEGVTAHPEEEMENFLYFEDVKGLPKGWVLHAQFFEGDVYYLFVTRAGS